MTSSSDHSNDEPAAMPHEVPDAGAGTAGASELPPHAPVQADAGAQGQAHDGDADPAAAAPSGRVAELEAELAATHEKWMRAEAETQNVRNRARREVEDARQYAVQKFAKDVVEAAENLRRGLQALPAGGEDGVVAKLREGFESVERSFLGILERNGIKATDPTGAAFDANLHQAMAEQPTADHPPGTVIQSWTSSWTLNGRLLKPAMVVVAKAPAAATAESGAGVDRTA